MKSTDADNLGAGKSLAHYRILKKLGAGGMGGVYLVRPDVRCADLLRRVNLPQ